VKISEENDDQTMLRQGVLTKLPDLRIYPSIPCTPPRSRGKYLGCICSKFGPECCLLPLDFRSSSFVRW